MGLATSGKSTLGQYLLMDGQYDFALEMDDVANWQGKKSVQQIIPDFHPGNPFWRRIDDYKSHVTYEIICDVADSQRTIVSGVWMHDIDVWSRLPWISRNGVKLDWRVIVLKPPTWEEAKERWIARAGPKEHFIKVFHFHPKNGPEVACLPCARKTMAQFMEARNNDEKHDSPHCADSKFHATWLPAWGEFPQGCTHLGTPDEGKRFERIFPKERYGELLAALKYCVDRLRTDGKLLNHTSEEHNLAWHEAPWYV